MRSHLYVDAGLRTFLIYSGEPRGYPTRQAYDFEIFFDLPFCRVKLGRISVPVRAYHLFDDAELLILSPRSLEREQLNHGAQ